MVNLTKALVTGLVGLVLAGTANNAKGNGCYPKPGQCIPLRGSKWKAKKYCPPSNVINGKQATIYFATNDWMVCSDDNASLKQYLRLNPNATEIIVEGFADIRGSEGFNRNLGDNRGNSIQEMLKAFGYKGKIQFTSY